MSVPGTSDGYRSGTRWSLDRLAVPPRHLTLGSPPGTLIGQPASLLPQARLTRPTIDAPLVRIGNFATTTARSRQTKDRYLFTRGLSTTRKNYHRLNQLLSLLLLLLASRCDKGLFFFLLGPLSLLSSPICSIALERFGPFGQSIPQSQAYLEHPCP